MKEITIELKQITRGLKYKGTIEELGIEYTLSFNIPINELDNERIPYTEDEQIVFFKERYNFAIKKDGKEIKEINDKLFIFMSEKVANMAISYYEDNSVSLFNEITEIIDGDDDKSGLFDAIDYCFVSDEEILAIGI